MKDNYTQRLMILIMANVPPPIMWLQKRSIKNTSLFLEEEIILCRCSFCPPFMHSNKEQFGHEAFNSKERIVAKAICAIAWTAKKRLLGISLMVPAWDNATLAPDTNKMLLVQKQYRIVHHFFRQNLESKPKQGREGHAMYDIQVMTGPVLIQQCLNSLLFRMKYVELIPVIHQTRH